MAVFARCLVNEKLYLPVLGVTARGCECFWTTRHYVMIFLIWIAAIVAAVVLYCRHTYSRFSKYGVKHLTPVPLLGDMARLSFQREHLFETVDRIYNSFPEDKFVGHVEYVRPMVFVRDIELVKRITVKDFEHFLDHGIEVDKDVDPFFGRNLFSLKGQEWKDMRSTLSPVFTSSKIKLMVPFMEEAGEIMIKKLRKDIQASATNSIDVEIKELCNRFASDVIASCAFGLKIDSQNTETEFYSMGKEASKFDFIRGLKFMGAQCVPGLMKFFRIALFSMTSQSFFRKLVTQTMKERETHNIIRPDVIHLLMELRKGTLRRQEEDAKATDTGFATTEESNLGQTSSKTAWSDDDLIAQAVIFFVAGFESVAQAMTFLVYEMALHPEVQEKLVEEIKKNDKKNGGKFNYTSIQEMTYLDMVVSELLRMWTPGGVIERICTKDYNLGKPNDSATQDFIIRKGVGVKIPVHSIHHDPQYFPEPHKFDPERFAPENRHKIYPYSYNPFGLGPRNCIASRFALCEVKVLIYQLLQHMEVSPCDKSVIPIKLDKSTISPVIKGGHWVRMKARE